jgi:hypothetical protein
MSLVKRIPLLGVLGGIVLIIVGFNQDNTALVIVGFVLIALGIFRQIGKN